VIVTGTDEATVVERARRGDRAAFGLLAERHEGALVAFATRRLDSSAEAADAVQAALVRALERLGDLDEPAAFRGWLYAITLNECRKRRRGVARLRAALERLAGLVIASEPDPLPDDEAAVVRAAVQALPEKQRLAVELRAWEGLSAAEAARVLGCSEGTVKANFHHALEKLRRTLHARR